MMYTLKKIQLHEMEAGLERTGFCSPPVIDVHIDGVAHLPDIDCRSGICVASFCGTSQPALTPARGGRERKT